jgi:phage tail sheath protein FI
MAETLLSPGVLARENDQSFLTAQPIVVGAAIVGPAAKGPVNIPTLVTSFSDYQNKFGAQVASGSNFYTYFTSVAAYNYFQQGGETLLVTRVASGSYTAASSSFVSASSHAGGKTLSVFEVQTPSEGTLMNSSGPVGSNGTLLSGSADNLRFEITSPSTSSGTFSLLIRRGDDTETNKIVLETWTNLSLDPAASNYISRVIGDQVQTVQTDADGTTYLQVSGSYENKSRYVTVKAVNYQTPNYFDNNGQPKAIYTSSIPLAVSGTFGGATGTPFVSMVANFYENIALNNTQGVVGANYTTALALLSNKDEYVYNCIALPGIYAADYSTQVTSMITNAEERGDNIAIIDLVKYAQTVTAVTSQASNQNTSYAATYWPWVQTPDPYTGNVVWVPASTLIPAVYAFNDTAAEAWFAPAGFNRGGLATAVRAERRLTQAERDTLYQAKVNPIATFPNQGLVVFGQKTLQTKASALDRVNVRRLLITLKSYISQIADNLVFDQNSIATRNAFLSQVNPYLASVQQRQGLYAFKVIMDDSNNTADVIDRNQLVGQIYIQPTKTAEFIYLDFNILPTGATFPA